MGHIDQSVDLVIFALHLAGVRSILGGINFMTRTKNLRLCFLSLEQVRLYIWSLFVTVFFVGVVFTCFSWWFNNNFDRS